MAEYEPFEIHEDLSEVKEWDGQGPALPEVPPGDYAMNIVNVAQDTVKSGKTAGQTQIKITFEVTDGDFTGKRVINNYSLSEAARGRLKKLIMAVGGNPSRIHSDDLMGATCLVTVIHNDGKVPTNPDGSVKTDSEGNPLAPRVFANVINERPIEVKPQPAPQPPPVTRGKAGGNNAQTTRRA